ncbi:hypothetical protein HNR19_002884 [Nocardioides thalensis]|uniref:Secreted protein n=1 Tax=Nocardioides thalensis TaxID=1914755 RepID=A0A853C590_9ACTN|nr:hypothetical protein [Nocardioides thalensis]NYJ02186.1 hypothetical protein [Nocardioides thalensis]
MSRTKRTERAARVRSLVASTPRAALIAAVAGVALGVAGGAHAADLITGKQIKDGSVTGRDVRDNTVAGFDVADLSLGADEFAGVLIGPPGPQGAAGRPGDDGLGEVFPQVATEVVGINATKTLVVGCGPGQVAIAGGLGGNAGGAFNLMESAPFGTAGEERGAWVVRAQNAGLASAPMTAWTLCGVMR